MTHVCLCFYSLDRTFYSKTCLKWPLKNKQNKGLKACGSLMQVKSATECSLWAFCNTLDLHLAIIGLENLFFFVCFEWPLKTGFTVHVLGSWFNQFRLFIYRRYPNTWTVCLSYSPYRTFHLVRAVHSTAISLTLFDLI